MLPQFCAGDIVLVRGNSLTSKLIRFFETGKDEERTLVNHCGVIVEDGQIVEALKRTVKRDFVLEYTQKKDQVVVYRPLDLSPEQLVQVVSKVNGYVGKKYGVLKIAAHFGDYCLGGRYVFRRLLCMDNYPICSWIPDDAFGQQKKNYFLVPTGTAQPDDIYDACSQLPGRFELIYALGPLRA